MDHEGSEHSNAIIGSGSTETQTLSTCADAAWTDMDALACKDLANRLVTVRRALISERPL